ncbi:MAG: UvrD-helicase domain-containing protein [Akkermansiaceae bacterium]|nr:UvrD-helicase domain-containing protein [Akkermansiaceae bacterium]MCP5551885.1 UvrD-helicase domain-containing protein [Akkermansiaceae bacterium]
MNPPPPAGAPLGDRHLLIQASAGSGKTHRLVGRVLRLLMAFRKPEQIVALTFTRKAAGEFFDRVLGALARAASSDEGAAKTVDEYKVPGLDRATALELLRLATDSLHRLSLGTLDSFYARILRTFPAEFGIGGDFDVIEESAQAGVRRDVFDAVLSDSADSEDFLTAFRQATFGLEEKHLLSNLDQFVVGYQRLLLDCPHRERWSRASAIWPEAPWWLAAAFDLDDIVRRLRARVPDWSAQHKSAGTGLEKFANTLPGFLHGATGRDFSTLHTRAMEALDDLHAGCRDLFPFHKKGGLQLEPEAQRALADAVGFILQREIASRLRQTGGIHEIVLRFEQRYHQMIRRRGRLSFEDILVILAGSAPGENGDAAENPPPELSMLDSRPDAGSRRLRVDFRLDGRFHHWLIDEFQDTSRPQWSILQPLIDEAVDDDSGERTFFYVGDEKQAIYGWRGGDSRLFQEVKARYDEDSRPPEQRIQEDHLDESWRSGPVILDAVNAVFGNYAGLANLLGPDHAPVILERWKRTNAHRHLASSKTADQPGYFRFVSVDAGQAADFDDDGDEAEGHDPCWRVVLDTLREIDPVANGLSVAILMRRVKKAAELADFLRQRGDIPVVNEGKTFIGADHPVSTAFRALLKFAAHPGDTEAWEHLAMTPALLSLDHETLQRERFALPARVLALLQDRGFGAVFQDWVARLAEGLDDGFDAFSTRRVEQISEVCRRFDLEGSRSIGKFLAYLDGYSISDPPSAGVVQIMTIHKSKGLTFDAVIVADLKPKAITALKDLDALKGHDRDRRLNWLMVSPRKDIALRVEPLRSAYLEAEMDCALEELCNLYVALTRARFANYLVTPRLETKAESTAPRNLIARQFEAAGDEPREGHVGGTPVTVHHESGDPNWARIIAESRQPAPPKPTAVNRPPTGPRRFPLRQRRIPSNAADKTIWGGAARLFAPDSGSATGFGTAVHALFEQIEWLDETEAALDRRLESEASRHPDFAGEALAQVRATLEIAAIRGRFLRHSYRDPVVWIEKRFEMIAPDGEWVSGVFDRVVLERDDAGRFTDGHILDYKTNRVADDAEIEAATGHYRSQMTVYRAALARLTGLPETAIGAELLFTRPGVTRRVF